MLSFDLIYCLLVVHKQILKVYAYARIHASFLRIIGTQICFQMTRLIPMFVFAVSSFILVSYIEFVFSQQ